MSIRVIVLLAVVSCGPTTSKPALSNAALSQPPSIDAREPTACERYAAVSDAVDACTALTDEQRQNIEQVRTDDLAARSENGLDGSEVDPEALCEASLEHALRVAKVACKL